MTNESYHRSLPAFAVGAVLGLVIALVSIAVTHTRVLNAGHLDWPMWVRVAVLSALLLIMSLVLVAICGATALGALRFWRDRHRGLWQPAYRTLWLLVGGMSLMCVIGGPSLDEVAPGAILYRAAVGAGLGLVMGLSQLAFAGEPQTS